MLVLGGLVECGYNIVTVIGATRAVRKMSLSRLAASPTHARDSPGSLETGLAATAPAQALVAVAQAALLVRHGDALAQHTARQP